MSLLFFDPKSDYAQIWEIKDLQIIGFPIWNHTLSTPYRMQPVKYFSRGILTPYFLSNKLIYKFLFIGFVRPDQVI